MTPPVPQLRIRQAPPRAPQQPPKVRISIGTAYRDLPLIDARHVADRIHDVCDRAGAQPIPELTQETQA